MRKGKKTALRWCEAVEEGREAGMRGKEKKRRK
jgi:hypothetical protein